MKYRKVTLRQNIPGGEGNKNIEMYGDLEGGLKLHTCVPLVEHLMHWEVANCTWLPTADN